MTPSGCARCGVPERDHCQRWTAAAGWHGYTPPHPAADQRPHERPKEQPVSRPAATVPDRLGTIQNDPEQRRTATHHPRQRRVAELTGQVIVKTAMSAIVAVADLVNTHQSLSCVRPGRERHTHPDGPFTCSPWAIGLGEPDGVWHWELANVRHLAEPVPCKGRLSLWDLTPAGADQPSEAEQAVLAQIGAPA